MVVIIEQLLSVEILECKLCPLLRTESYFKRHLVNLEIAKYLMFDPQFVFPVMVLDLIFYNGYIKDYEKENS